jgi:predicted RNA-binding protein with PUA-like domain
MNYWLVKSEPSCYSWDEFVKDGCTVWEGVRNYAARNNLRAMKNGDKVLYYHSNEGLQIVGVAKVVKENYPDPSAKEGDWSVVDLEPVKPLKRPVTLAEVKSLPPLKDMQLIKLSRLSVSAVTKDEFDFIVKMGEGK